LLGFQRSARSGDIRPILFGGGTHPVMALVGSS
jgi:hypothetical protein